MVNEKSKKNNRPYQTPKRNKQSYAQYVWIRQIYREIDEIKVRLDKLENRKINIGENEQSNKANENGQKSKKI